MDLQMSLYKVQATYSTQCVYIYSIHCIINDENAKILPPCVSLPTLIDIFSQHKFNSLYAI